MWASRRVLLWTTVAADGVARGTGWSVQVKAVVEMAAYLAVVIRGFATDSSEVSLLEVGVTVVDCGCHGR